MPMLRFARRTSGNGSGEARDPYRRLAQVAARRVLGRGQNSHQEAGASHQLAIARPASRSRRPYRAPGPWFSCGQQGPCHARAAALNLVVGEPQGVQVRLRPPRAVATVLSTRLASGVVLWGSGDRRVENGVVFQ